MSSRPARVGDPDVVDVVDVVDGSKLTTPAVPSTQSRFRGCWPARRIIGGIDRLGVGGRHCNRTVGTYRDGGAIDRLVQALINAGSRIDPLIAKRAQRIVEPIATAFHEELDAQG